MKSMVRSLLIVPFLCFESSRADHDLNRMQKRGLALTECPVDDFNYPRNDESHEGFFDSYSQGASGRNIVERLRTKPESYYQTLLDNVIMFLCDVETASERCIEEDSPYASKDWSGETCVKAADYECPSGFCERASNCYWNSVYEGQNRTTRFEIDAYEKAAEALYGTNNSYVREIGQLGLIGCIVSSLLLLCWVVFFIGRYLCCCLWSPFEGFCSLCSPVPKKDGYKMCQHIIIPVFLYLLALVGIITAGSLAFVGNEDISLALSNTFLHADGLVEDLLVFLGRSKVPLESLHTIVEDAALDARSIFDGTEYVKEDAMQIVKSFVGYFRLHSEGLNETNAIRQFNSASVEFDEKVTPITDNVQAMLDTLKVDLYEQVDSIKGGLSNALDQLESFELMVTNWQGVVYDYEGKELGIRDVRRAAVMTLFLISIFVAAVGFFGILVWKRRMCRCSSAVMIKATGFFSALLGSLSFIVASAFLCSSFVLFDACQTSNIITRDFEPFVGDKVSPGPNACFNDTNLAVAFNVTERVNFQQKLDDGLEAVAQVNVSEQFELVTKPLSDIELLVEKFSNTALSAVNKATTANQILCPFNDTYTKDQFLSPWELNRDSDITPYIIRDNKGLPTPYTRVAEESSETYLSRIYNKAGTCSAPTSCCIKYSSTPPTDCESNTYAGCDHGANCAYPCEMLKAGIVEGYKQFVLIRQKEMAMIADLGLSCPVDIDDDFDDTCPTQDFRSQYANTTMFAQIHEYKNKIVRTRDDLVGLATTSVGDAMIEVENFLCTMNVSFVERRYNEVKHDMCVTLFGGVAQINWALWLLGISLEVVAVIAHILVVRVNGVSEKEAAATKVLSAGGRRSFSRAKLY